MHSVAPTDRAHRFTLTRVLDVPVGRGRKYYSRMNRPLDTVVSGRELARSFFLESAKPIVPPQRHNLVRWKFHTSQYRVIPGADSEAGQETGTR
jgi:hypothetical protein